MLGSAPITMKYRTLGRTGLMVSEIGFGGGAIADPAVLDAALDIGINFIDTARVYMHGRSEEIIGTVMKQRRKDAIIATKFDRHAENSVVKLIASCEASLRALQTDWIDIIQIHGVTDFQRAGNALVFTAFEKLRAAGKVRFLGISSHSDEAFRLLDLATEMGQYDTVLIPYNPARCENFPARVRHASQAGIGIIGMKSVQSYRQAQPKAETLRGVPEVRRAISWILSDPSLATVLITMTNILEVHEFAAASASNKEERI